MVSDWYFNPKTAQFLFEEGHTLVSSEALSLQEHTARLLHTKTWAEPLNTT